MRARTAQAHKCYCAPRRLSNVTRSNRFEMPPNSAVLNAILALADLEEVAVRIPNIAARFPIRHDRLRNKLRASALPQLIRRLNIRHAKIHEAIDVIWIGHAEHDRRLGPRW